MTLRSAAFKIGGALCLITDGAMLEAHGVTLVTFIVGSALAGIGLMLIERGGES